VPRWRLIACVTPGAASNGQACTHLYSHPFSWLFTPSAGPPHTLSQFPDKMSSVSLRSKAQSLKSFRVTSPLHKPENIWALRKHVAAPRFSFAIFLDEFIMNLLGWIIMPYILWRHGLYGAINRGFLSHALQIMFFLMFWYVNAIAGYYWFYNSPEFTLSFWNVVVIDMLFTLRYASSPPLSSPAVSCRTCTRFQRPYTPECGCRALLIGVKYATNVPSEMRTMDRQAQTFRDFGRKTLLAGWLAPGTSLLSEELERAMVRVCPDLVRHRVEYANTEDMRASLTAMEACLPSYFRIHGYEIQGDSVVHVGGDGEGRAPKSDRMGRASMYSFILSTAHLTVSCIGDYKRKIHPSASVPEVALPYSQTIMPSDITSLLAHPIVTSATATEVCIPSVIASPRPLKTPMLSQSPIQTRPSLPAKLFVWHLLYTVYVRNNPSWAKMSAVTAVIAGMGFAAVLFVTDVYLPAVPLSWSWQDSSCFICSVVACGFWMMLQAAYSFMGIVDMSRRLDVSKQVAALISVDNMSIHQLGMNVLPAVVEGEGSSSDSDAENDSVVSPVGDASKLMVESPIGIDKWDGGAHTSVPVTFQQDLQAIDFRLRNFTEVDVEEVVREHDKPVAAVVRTRDTCVCVCV
jgi:hypothetical protein